MVHLYIPRPVAAYMYYASFSDIDCHNRRSCDDLKF